MLEAQPLAGVEPRPPAGRGARPRHPVAQLENLRDLVGGEQQRGVVARATHLLAQRELALAVVADLRVVADGTHERRDDRAEARGQLFDAHGRVLDDVVQEAGGDELVGAARVAQQPPHLDRMLDERRTVAVAALARVRARGEVQR